MRDWVRSVEETGDEGRETELIVACAWCDRIKLEGWVDPEVAIRELRTFEWAAPPCFTHGICDRCFDGLEARRVARASALAA